MGVRGFAPSMVGGPCRPRSSSKIIAPKSGTLGFQNQFGIVGIEALAKPIFVRGYAPSMEVRSAPARTALAPAGYACEASGRAFVLFSRVCQIRSTRRFACTPFLAPKALRQIGKLVFGGRTLEACTNLSCRRFVLCWERGGDRSIGKANLRKGR